MQTVYLLCADLVVVIHFAFVLFVVLGGVLVLRWPRLAWLHIPTLLWGVFTEFAGVLCPLTPLEVTLRELGGQAGYEGDFIARYVLPILYPVELTRELQFWLGVAALVPNILIYGYYLIQGSRSPSINWKRRPKRSRSM